MNINYIPVVGWLIALFFQASIAVPFWFLWTYCEYGKRFFFFLPEVYQSLAFLECIGLFIVLSILRTAIYPKFSADISVKENEK